MSKTIHRPLLLLCALLPASALSAPLAAATPELAAVERASLFTHAPGARIEDAGVIVIPGGSSPRREAFEVVRDAQGQRIVTSVIRSDVDQWRVEGRWVYGADGQAQAARGIGDYAGQPVVVDIAIVDGQASITADIGGSPVEATAACDPCLIDMAPSALPMFTMTRLYDEAAGGVQHFNWIGRGLIRDEVLTNGRVSLHKLGSGTFTAPDEATSAVRQYAFTEVLEHPDTGHLIELAFNLYVDADDRPLGFAMPNLNAMRLGFEALPQQLPPIFAGSAAD
ncbi:hypothetical protein CKO25_02530 [Thiocapsa imhoffii]|uniref:Uncharacterized protein n=1 Tax=Thiocapsa imhoffii TaxID=382777 RepID=A0A9X0WG50_9GAMM|nr:hypothetical protein [Thiocapsa imhoffii]MBK1643552.1 hypothetical protein [Thiocapsa imhoffii]